MVLLSAPLSAFPYCSSLVSLYSCSFLSGLGTGSLDNAVNVLILSIWEGGNTGPYMHALHFTWGLGAFLAPITAKPFLVNKEGNETLDTIPGHITDTEAEQSFLTIRTLYPALSSYGLLTTVACLYYFFKDIRPSHSDEHNAEAVEEAMSGRRDLSRRSELLIIGLLAILFFLYNGLEVAFGTFIPVFAVKSNLRLTRADSSDVAAIFWGTFAGMRGLSVVLAIFAKPGVVMWGSLRFVGISNS